MTINEYQKLAMTTLNKDLSKKDVLINGVMGLCGESGEAIDLVKKWLAQGHELDEEKLKLVFPTKENSTELDYSAISDAKMKEGVELPLELEFTDKEIASVVDEMLMKGILAKKLPNLEYINTLTINVLELIITPEELSNGFNPDSANIHAYFKIDTTNVRKQRGSFLI